MLKRILLIFILLLGIFGGVEHFKQDLPTNIRHTYEQLVKKASKEITKYQTQFSKYLPELFDHSYPSKKNNNNVIDVTKFKPKGSKEIFCKNNIYQKAPVVQSILYQGKVGTNGIVTLCYSGYALQYKDQYKIPLWTAEKLTKQRIKLGENGNRPAHFYPDPNLAKKFHTVITHEDYVESHYDRGHVAPSRDMPLADRLESFYMSNIVPQTAENNRFIWANIEQISRCMVTKYKTEIYIVNVPVINLDKNKPQKKLKTKTGKEIVIPNYMAKAIYIPQRNEIGVYLTKNNRSKTEYKVISINKLKELSHIDVFPSLSNQLKNKVSKFPDPNKVEKFCY